MIVGSKKGAASLRHTVTRNIRNAIAVGRFKACARMRERDLCEMIGVGRTLIRDAPCRLKLEGLVEGIAHRGPILARVTAAQAEVVGWMLAMSAL